MSVPGGDKRYTFPALTDAPTALLCLPIPLIPYARQWIGEMQQQHIWQTREDWFAAYQAFAELEEELMAGCMQQLIAEQQRLYRLIDTSLNGTQYTSAGGVVTPALPAVPPASASAPNAMRAHVGRLWHLAENEVTGKTAVAGEGVTGAPALTDDQTARELLRRLTVGVDGNSDPAPVDNLLQALRGTAQATTDRNLTSLIDQVENLLTEIKGKLL
jgi:hypothetical protein